MKARGDRKLEALARVPLFRGCNDRELRKIAGLVDAISLDAGDVLIEEGRPGWQAFVIAEGSGTVRVRKRKVRSIGPGDVVGEMSLLDMGPRSATVVADTPMRAFVLDSRQFHSVLAEVPGIAKKILAELAGRVRELTKSPMH